MALGINNIVGRRRARSSGWCSAACWRRSTGGWCSWSRCRSALFGTVWAYLKLEELGDPQPRADRLAGQHHLRARPDPGHDRHHLRHPPVRRPADGLGAARGCSRARRRRRLAGRVRGRRARASRTRCSGCRCSASGRSPSATFELPVGGRARRPDVHADHLAAGHLAAAARLQLHATRRCGPASTCCR